jgi:hypothetical protein
MFPAIQRYACKMRVHSAINVKAFSFFPKDGTFRKLESIQTPGNQRRVEPSLVTKSDITRADCASVAKPL